MSGIFTIATATQANREIVTKENGVLIKDAVEEIARGLEYYWQHKEELNEAKIRASLADYSWANICNKSLQPIIDKI
jgi:glycosyltransferase involved in cell wall biosynthesis